MIKKKKIFSRNEIIKDAKINRELTKNNECNFFHKASFSNSIFSMIQNSNRNNYDDTFSLKKSNNLNSKEQIYPIYKNRTFRNFNTKNDFREKKTNISSDSKKGNSIRIKLVKPFLLIKNKDLSLKLNQNEESKKYLRKLDIELNTLLSFEKKNQKKKKLLLSEDNRKIKTHYLLKNIKIENHNKFIQLTKSIDNKNNFMKLNNNIHINKKNDKISLKSLYSKTKQFINKNTEKNHLNQILNNMTRNVTFINQKNFTLSDKKAINLLKEEEEKYNILNLKKKENNLNKRNKNEYPPISNRYLLTETKDNIIKNKIIDFELHSTMGNLDEEINKINKLKIQENLNSLILKNFFLQKGNSHLKKFFKNNYQYFIDSIIDTKFNNYDTDFFYTQKHRLRSKKLYKINNSKRFNRKINKKNQKLFVNLFKKIGHDNIQNSLEVDLDDDTSVKSLPEVENLIYRNKVINIFDDKYAPKKIEVKNNSNLSVIYLKYDLEENIPCYENGKQITNKNLLVSIYERQKENERIQNKKNVSQASEDNLLDNNYYEKNKIYLDKLNAEIIKDILQNIEPNMNTMELNKLINNKKNENKEKLKQSINNEKKKIIKNKNNTQNSNDKNKMAFIKKPTKSYKDYKRSNTKIKFNNMKNDKYNGKNNKNAENTIDKYMDSEEDENKDLNDILKNEEDDINYELLINEDKNNNEEIKRIKKTKFKKHVEKAILHAVLFLKQKNIKIDDKKILLNLLRNNNFRKSIDYIKSKSIQNIELAQNLGIIYCSKVADEDIIDFYYRIFNDKTTPYHKVFSNEEEYLKNTNWKDLSQFKYCESVSKLLENEQKKEKQKLLKKLAEINKKMISDLKKQDLKYEEEARKRQMTLIKKKKERKKSIEDRIKKGLCYGLFKDIEVDHKKAVINELTLTNELKYQIKMANDDESRERFKYLLDQIRQLKKLDVNSYINSILDNYNIYKGEINDLIKAKEMEERINKFKNNLCSQREKYISKRNIMNKKFCVKDCTFQSSMIDIENSNYIHNIKNKGSDFEDDESF